MNDTFRAIRTQLNCPTEVYNLLQNNAFYINNDKRREI